MAPKIAIVYYTTYGHVAQLAQAEKKGVEAAGCKVDMYQIAETLPEEVLTKMHAPPKSADVPVLDSPDTLKQYDGILFGMPTRFGNFPVQWKSFWDQTGGIWYSGGFQGKYVGMFVSTANQGGGQESTFISAMSTYIHHGMIFVPLGGAPAAQQLASFDEIHGGSAWGAGSLAGATGQRQPSAKELEVAEIQGREFAKQLSRVTFS